GSLVALASVVVAVITRDSFGGDEASVWEILVGCCAAVAFCGLIGFLSGGLIAFCGLPPFIVTLAGMSIARGLAFRWSKNETISEFPSSFSKFSTDSNLMGIPNLVLLMAILYVIAHLIMTRTTLGRWIYAVGGNREAARLSGVPVLGVLILVYTASGALAGLGGVILASKLDAGSPLYGNMYELSVITAVVVGGTSLAGGEGKIFGTLIGALIIAVINNGMNLMDIESFDQDIVLGFLILAAVLIDAGKKKGLIRRAFRYVTRATSTS
ncbi:MAG: ABC transporter permease, partial [Planctomycetales bacterium]